MDPRVKNTFLQVVEQLIEGKIAYDVKCCEVELGSK
jgi:hypothetical protein